MPVKQIFYVVFGCVSLGIGAVGAVVPLLPSFPFLLFSAFCFARSSKRLNNWFIGTALYRRHLADYVKGRGMTIKTKARIMVLVTLLMGVGFILMRRVPVGRIILAAVWLFHILYFLFVVKTIRDV